jgi:hypothetical protein
MTSSLDQLSRNGQVGPFLEVIDDDDDDDDYTMQSHGF